MSYDDASEWNYLNFDGTLTVNCWCEDTIVFVPQELVKRGVTLPCSKKECQKIAREQGQVNVSDDTGLAMSQVWRQVRQSDAGKHGRVQQPKKRMQERRDESH